MSQDTADTSRTESGEYLIRPYEPDDRRAFRSLYESVFDKQRTDGWVEWRYSGPYADGVRMIVAERDGELVGAEPFISLPMCGGGETVLALQPADAMVHPEHRRNGLLTRMTERAIEQYEDRWGFFFNFPNESAKSVYLRLGWQEVGRTATAYRVHTPSAFVDAPGANSLIDADARGCYRCYDAVVDAVSRRGHSSVPTVRRHDDPPVEVLESLYERARPDALHVPRTAAFYRWRLDNPVWDAVTYVAESAGEPVAALNVATQTSNGTTTTKVLDALPLVDADAGMHERLLVAALDDHRSSDMIAVAEDTLAASVRRRCGLLRDDRRPLSAVSTPSTVVVRPFSLGGRNWTVGGRRLTERSNWELSFVGQDTSV